jgi:hypothetical protein
MNDVNLIGNSKVEVGVKQVALEEKMFDKDKQKDNSSKIGGEKWKEYGKLGEA